MTNRERARMARARENARLAELGISESKANKLRALSRRWNKLAEDECSVDDWRQRRNSSGKNEYDYQHAEIERKARRILPPGVELYIQGDCRGLSFYICGPGVTRPLDSHYTQGIGLG